MRKGVYYLLIVIICCGFCNKLFAQDTINVQISPASHITQIDSNVTSSNDSLFSDSLYMDSLCIDSVLNEVIVFAKTYLGAPYKFRGSTGVGFDCSGFINHIFKPFGYSMPLSSSSYAFIGESIDLSNLKKGDFMLFKGRNINSSRIGHVAMVIESDIPNNVLKIIHSTRRGVVIDNYFTSGYYSQRFIMGRRPEY